METEYVITNPKFETDLTQFKNRINELMLITDPSIFEVLEMYEASSFIKKTIDKFLKDNKGKYLVKSTILCKILYNALTIFYLANLIYFLDEESHSSC